MIIIAPQYLFIVYIFAIEEGHQILFALGAGEVSEFMVVYVTGHISGEKGKLGYGIGLLVTLRQTAEIMGYVCSRSKKLSLREKGDS